MREGSSQIEKERERRRTCVSLTDRKRGIERVCGWVGVGERETGVCIMH